MGDTAARAFVRVSIPRMTSTPAFDARAFRDAVGRFATGVTVVTTHDEDEFRAMTANSFTSVSLDPPLVLICVVKSASIHEPIASSRRFAINILGEDQEDVSGLFARHGELEEPMGGVPYHLGQLGVPLIEGALGWLECRLWADYDGGDHTIYVGEVAEIHVERAGGRPLLFFAGGYASMLDGASD
jgi:flavin reductase (DIM6/NTAB) family NADH-FMN oxidoreductase RutF